MGKGGGSSYTPTEQPDNLKSKQKLSIIDMLCEGQIEGPVGGLRGVYLNKTQVQGDDGTNNFAGVNLQWVAGTQAQDYLSGFPSSENEVSVGSEVKHATPIVRTITDVDIDRIRITVGVSALYEITDKGDTYGSWVQMLVQVGNGSIWRTVETVDINGKTRSQYLRSVIINDLPARPFNIRVVRTNEDSTSSRLENKTLWSSYTEIIDTKLTYPNSAVVGLQFDSEQFNGVPSRQYLIDGLIVQVPDNYDPVNRTYNGLWTGNFKPSWTNNPAWIFYDLVTNERYGLGKRLGQFGCDKFSLYIISQYCDQLVDDGFGGKEPRMTCNAYITDQRQAKDLLDDLASVFRAIPVWDGLQMSCIMDRPSDPVWRYSNANVIDGKFSYSSSAQKARHTAVHVRYVDPNNGWETATEYVADDTLIARYGLNVSQVDAFGCTSRGQAHRAGKWILETERLEKQTVSFQVGREGIKHLPGDIIEVADNNFAGARIGGRIVSIDDGKQTVTLDRDVVITDDEQAFFGYIDNNGIPQKVQVFSHPEPNILVLGRAIDGMTDYGMWTLSTATIKPRLFRALGISEDEGIYTISAIQHVPEKEGVVDNGTVFDPDTNTLYSGRIPPVEHLQIEAMPDSDVFQIRMTWDTPRVMSGLVFDVKLMREDMVHKREIVSDTEFLCGNLPLGNYSVAIRGKNPAGQLGTETTTVFEIGPPSLPDHLQVTVGNFNVTIKPVVTKPTSLGTQYEFYKGMTEAEVIAQSNYLGRATVLNDVNCTPDTEYWYGVQAVNGVGRSNMMIQQVRTQLKPEDILDLIGPEIPKLDWAKELSEMVEENSSNIVLLEDRAALVVNKDNRVTGITITAGDEASAIDFLADFVSFTDPDSFERNLYWDNNRKTLILKGEIQLLDGTSVSSKNDLGNGAGGIFRIKSASGVFPGSAEVANALFRSAFGTDPGIDTVLTFYSVNGAGKVDRADSRMYNGTDWITPMLFIDGDLIALGTIRGDRLVAGTEIYAPVIRGGALVAASIQGGTLNINDRFIVDQYGNVAIRNANASVGLQITSSSVDVYNDYGQLMTRMGKLW
ncbi:host specificity protein J [Limnobaculum zhutongyuii]|uniref:Host specificity protein J n=1 Tax=Limnobaculum zhutongyuii TaxID=2498113 RepID=A0A411WLN6_9GAMM|nr:phage tail protein [Limnobaculum zhutongyuii]QBH97149.1 host specificity protein J [Limnobaculum zhutongyuii]TQS88408.1 host specificity protein J [Limnobaculum zhutongyuii]